MKTLKIIAIVAAVLSLLVPISAAVMSDQGVQQDPSNDSDYAYLMTYDVSSSQITGVYKDGNIATRTNPETGVHQGQQGSWTWSSTTGLGPFNMYYQAVNTVDHSAYSDVMNGGIGHVAYILDPADLKKVIIDGQSVTSANFSSHLNEYNVMLVIPTIYWYSDGAGNVYISNTDSNTNIPSQVNAKMNAYAHTVNGTMQGDKIVGGDVYPYIMIGVYEAYCDSTMGMMSVSGNAPTVAKAIYGFRATVDTANARITDDQGTYVQWNYYQYTLYKLISQAQMGSKDSQATIGIGNTSGSAQSTQGLGDAQGPYANVDNSYCKLFIENPWGSVNSFVDNVYVTDRTVKAGSGLSPVSTSSSFTIDGTDYTGGATALPSVDGWITGSYEGSQTWDIQSSASTSSGSYQTNDYVSSNTGDRVLYVGGHWSYGAGAGLSYWSSGSGLPLSWTSLGSRLAYYTAGDAPAQVTITVNDPSYGSVDVGTLSVDVGTPISASGNILTVGTDTVTQTPAQATAQYTYAFDRWDGIPQSGTVDQDVTITAVFTRLTIIDVPTPLTPTYNGQTQSGIPSDASYTVTGGTAKDQGTYTATVTPAQGYCWSDGTQTPEQVQFTISPLTAAIAWGTTLFPCDGESHVPVATVTNLIGSDICTVTVDGAQTQPGTYTATVSALSNSNYALPDPAPTAQFTITEMPVVTVTVYPIGYGSVSGNSYNVYYNTTYTTQDNVLTFSDGQVCTATPATPTVEYVYVFDNWSSDSGTITQDTTLTANFHRDIRTYIVTIEVNESEWGSVDVQSVTVPYGTAMSTSQNVLTIGTDTVTATPSAQTPYYTYTFDTWDGTGTVQGDMTVTAYFGRTAVQYTVTLNVDTPAYGSVSPSSLQVDYKTPITLSGNVLSIGDTEIVFTPASPTQQYQYVLDSWLGIPDPAEVTDDITLTAHLVRQVRQYTVTVTVNDPEYGSVDIDTVTAGYGSSITVSGNVLTVGGTAVTQTPQQATQQYTYAFGSWSSHPSTLREDITVTAVFTRTVNSYTVTYDGNGGTPATVTATVQYGDEADLSKRCTYEGHIFLGWALEQTATVPIHEYVVDSDVTLYAVYGLPVILDIPVTEVIGDMTHTEYTKHGTMGMILMLIPLMLALFLMIALVRGLNLGIITKD